MEIDYLKIANLEGEQMPLFYTENPRTQDDLEIIENWGTIPISLELNGKKLEVNKDYFAGYDQRLQGADLILWIKLDSQKDIEIKVYPGI